MARRPQASFPEYILEDIESTFLTKVSLKDCKFLTELSHRPIQSIS